MPRPASRRVTPCIIAAAVIACFAHRAAAELTYRPLPAEPRALVQLVDCRSTTVRHERRVKLGEPWSLDNAMLTFTLDAKGELAVAITTKSDNQPATQTLRRLPALVRVSAFGGDYGLCVRLETDSRHVMVSSAHGLAVPVGGGHACIIDSNLDGTVGNEGDGMVADDSRTVLPFDGAGAAWQLGGAVAVRRNDGGAWEIAALPMPYPNNDDHARAWRLVNWRRQQAGAFALEYDDSVEPGMRRHFDYQIKNNVTGHGEDPMHEGYTPEGRLSGMQCVLGYGLKTHVAYMSEQLDTLFHRNQVLDPGLAKSGMLLYRDRFAFNVRRFKRSALLGRPIVYPAHGMTDVNPRFNSIGEWPMPADAPPRTNRLGVCVSLVLGQYEAMAKLPRPPVIALSRVTPAGKAFPVEGQVFYPGRVPPSDGMLINYFGCVAFVPTQPLAPRATYHAAIDAPVVTGRDGNKWVFADFKYEWEFTTGLARRE